MDLHKCHLTGNRAVPFLAILLLTCHHLYFYLHRAPCRLGLLLPASSRPGRTAT